ncbi:hypothetical protein BBM40_13500 [Vibrio parahaemolyticus]|nr:hypothetical protein BBM40_13500 [Vibrio parahaemolyticus]
MFIHLSNFSQQAKVGNKLQLGNTHNKQFKRDSQRLAFLLLLQFKCLWHSALGWVVALFTP